MQVDPDPLNAADYSETEVPDIINFAREAAERAGESADAAATSATAAAQSADEAQNSADDSAEYARQSKSWAVPSTDPNEYGTDTNNSKYWSDRAHEDYLNVENDLNLVNGVIALLRLLLGDLQLTTESGNSLAAESDDVIIMNY
jgi:hypothetical protein